MQQMYLRFGKDLVVQHGFTTNLKGIDWLKRHYKDHRVHAVNFPGILIQFILMQHLLQLKKD